MKELTKVELDRLESVLKELHELTQHYSTLPEDLELLSIIFDCSDLYLKLKEKGFFNE